MDRDALAQACHALPLFPLPGIVLMPGAALPLHVFEERYRALIRDVLARDGVLAVPQINADGPVLHPGQPALFPYTAVGRIGGHQQLPDGRFNVIIHPLGRVVLRNDELSVGGYRIAHADVLDDLPYVPARLEVVGDRVRMLMAPLLSRMSEGASAVQKALAGLPAVRVAEGLAPIVLTEAEARQSFLAENDPIARAELVEAAILMLLAEGNAAGAAEA